MDEIEKAIKDEKDNSSAEDTKQSEDIKPTEEEARKAKAAAELADLEAAKTAATAELKRIREEKRKAKKDPSVEIEEEEIPAIDDSDPSAKAWNKRIQDTVSPALEEAEKGKAEIRQFALDQFLQSRPALAKNPDKLKEMMAVYERLHTASERTVEGVLLDLDKAYAATFHKELLEAAQEQKVETARRDAIFSDAGVSRGSTTYSSQKSKVTPLSQEEQAILAKWGMSESEWRSMKDEQLKKEAESV